jgi:hypothetical protein
MTPRPSPLGLLVAIFVLFSCGLVSRAYSQSLPAATAYLTASAHPNTCTPLCPWPPFQGNCKGCTVCPPITISNGVGTISQSYPSGDCLGPYPAGHATATAAYGTSVAEVTAAAAANGAAVSDLKYYFYISGPLSATVPITLTGAFTGAGDTVGLGTGYIFVCISTAATPPSVLLGAPPPYLAYFGPTGGLDPIGFGPFVVSANATTGVVYQVEMIAENASCNTCSAAYADIQLAISIGSGFQLHLSPPLQITTTSLPNATSGASYSTTLAATGGSGAGYTWLLQSGSLPAGFSLSSAGVLSSTGSPAASAGPYSFTVQVTDSAGNTATQPLILSVVPVTCQVGNAFGVQLPQIIVPVSSSKAWQIGYGRLGLIFTTVDPGNNSNILCEAHSNVGSLPIFLARPSIPDFLKNSATSVASASLTVFKPSTTGNLPTCNFQASARNACILNGSFSPSAHYAKWHTDGFTTEFSGVPAPFLGTGPLTFWVNLEALGLSPDVTATQNLNSLLQTTDVFVHTTLIQNLPRIDRVAWFQDPGAVNLLVRDQNNLVTGIPPNGELVAQIPRSFYYQSPTNPAVVIPEFADGTYQITVTGVTSGPFLLSLLTANIPFSTAEATVHGNITQGESVTYTAKIATGGDGLLNVTLFDTCLKDDSTGNLFQFNSTTGQYLFIRCSDGFTLNGTGVVRQVNGVLTVTDSKSDRRVSAGFYPGQRTGSATIYLMVAQGIWQTFRINATNVAAVCICPSSAR